jgi:hypothetical protein
VSNLSVALLGSICISLYLLRYLAEARDEKNELGMQRQRALKSPTLNEHQRDSPNCRGNSVLTFIK